MVDLNADLGEGFVTDYDMLPWLTSVNICTGHHAGSQELTFELFQIATKMGKRIGAHIGFPDRPTMGRELPPNGVPATWIESIHLQFSELTSNSENFRPDYIKPHGALYHWLNQQPTVQESDWHSIWDHISASGLPFLGLEGNQHQIQCLSRSITFIREGFCERGYDDLGHLIPRWQLGAMLHNIEDITQQALDLSDKVDSICIHGDRDDAPYVAEAVYKKLIQEGIEVGF